MAGARSIVLFVALLALAALALPGCFVLEELEAGNEIMEQHSRAHAASASEGGAEETARAAEDGGRRRSLWEGGRALDPRERDAEIARCQLEGRSLFMARSDCLARGGSPQ